MELETMQPIQGDGVRIAQVLDNLFTNAIKYAPGSPINVFLHQVEQKQVIQFEDNGPGIPQESLPLIFERFYRATSDKIQGTGLGLAIVKSVVELHGGDVYVRSQPGKGSTFGMTLSVKGLGK